MIRVEGRERRRKDYDHYFILFRTIFSHFFSHIAIFQYFIYLSVTSFSPWTVLANRRAHPIAALCLSPYKIVRETKLREWEKQRREGG